ncbi:MAG: winged helix-turn-helix transcriptional regulator [Clostridia bacterium]|nr:winged helix-turn-helix transcriptional regulator [Clostridia bacterium]
MRPERFDRFILLVDGAQKCINKIKGTIASAPEVKGVHVFWLYKLLVHPEGLTATELAAESMIDRSLVSREINELCRGGYITVGEGSGGKRKNYNARIRLTDKGKALASRIREGAIALQERVDTGISEEELAVFYRVFEALCANLHKITAEPKVATE